LDSYLSVPIVAIEARDDVTELIRETRLSDPDSWRRVIQAVPLADRQYLQQVHDLLNKYAVKWRNGADSVKERMAFVYNFRSGACLLYDVSI
jgi:eukaryotic translation initiation factor 2-alpha kinase 4